MIVKEALHRTAKTLAAHSIEDAFLEAEVMLMHVLAVDRAGLYLRLGDVLSTDSEEAIGQVMERRLEHEPLAYITGSREFFGSDFYVAPGALVPRPDTESLVEATIELVDSRFPAGDAVIADVGTGSGAIAVSLALRLPQARIYATDICPRALEVALINCRRHNVGVQLLEGDLLDSLPEPVDIIVANLPYVRDGEMGELSAEIRLYEPSMALAGGGDGLDVVRRLVADAPARLRPGGVILLEIAPGQVRELTEWVEGNLPGADVSPFQDLIGATRFVEVTTLHRSLAMIDLADRKIDFPGYAGC